VRNQLYVSMTRSSAMRPRSLAALSLSLSSLLSIKRRNGNDVRDCYLTIFLDLAKFASVSCATSQATRQLNVERLTRDQFGSHKRESSRWKTMTLLGVNSTAFWGFSFGGSESKSRYPREWTRILSRVSSKRDASRARGISLSLSFLPSRHEWIPSVAKVLRRTDETLRACQPLVGASEPPPRGRKVGGASSLSERRKRLGQLRQSPVSRVSRLDIARDRRFLFRAVYCTRNGKRAPLAHVSDKRKRM